MISSLNRQKSVVTRASGCAAQALGLVLVLVSAGASAQAEPSVEPAEPPAAEPAPAAEAAPAGSGGDAPGAAPAPDAAAPAVEAGAVPAPRPESPAAAGVQQIARELFERGKAKWLERQFEEAAALLVASQEQLAVPSTLLLLADSYEQLGRLKSASDLFGRAALLAEERGNPTLAHSARTREAALLPRIPQLELRVPAPVPVGLLVTLNGVEIPARQLNVPLAMDAGYYQLEARAPGFAPSLGNVRLTNDRVHPAGPRVAVILLSPLPSVAPPVARVTPRPPASAPRGAGQRELGFWLGAGGVAAALAGGVVMLVSWSEYTDSRRECEGATGSPRLCPKAAFDQRNRALQLAGVATGFGLTGAALLGTGLALYLTPQSDAEGMPAGAGLALSGAF